MIHTVATPAHRNLQVVPGRLPPAQYSVIFLQEYFVPDSSTHFFVVKALPVMHLPNPFVGNLRPLPK
jgi:hypothetical protein